MKALNFHTLMYIITAVVATIALVGVSMVTAARDNAQLCEDSLNRACYELDVGPLNLAKLPAQARAMDTFIINPNAGANKWRACLRTNEETLSEEWLTTTYCGFNSVEKVKTCYLGSSNVMMYYYTGECKLLGYSACSSEFALPENCLANASSGELIAYALQDQIINKAPDLPYFGLSTTCYPMGSIQVYVETETYGDLFTDGSSVHLTRIWYLNQTQPCEPDSSAYYNQTHWAWTDWYTFKVAWAYFFEDKYNQLFSINPPINYGAHIAGCSDFTFDYYGNDENILFCDSPHPEFCNCNN